MPGPLSRVLLTGAGGFIGRALAQALQNEVQDLICHQGRHQGDLADFSVWENLPKVDAVIHLAGVTGVEPFLKNPDASWRNNLNQCLNLCQYASQGNTKKVIFASSYVYGQPQYLPVDEKHPTAPTQAYQACKLAQEQMLAAFARDFQFQMISLRLFNVYGPGQDEAMLVPTILKQISQGQVTLRDPHPRRDFIHLNDVAQAFCQALKLSDDEGQWIFNVGSGQTVSVAELVKILQRFRPFEVNYLHHERRGEVSEVCADIQAIQSALDWAPQVDINTGLKELIQCEY